MATTERFMPTPPEAVWDVLADARSYGRWVVGSKEIRDADPGWPTSGTRFHHTIGFGPFTIKDHTVSLRAERPHRLELRVKGRPLITGKVTLEMIPQSGGTLVRMHENPDGVFSVLAISPLFHALTRKRNDEALERLEELALQRA